MEAKRGMRKRFLLILLSLALLLAAAGCGKRTPAPESADTAAPQTAQTAEPAEKPADAPDEPAAPALSRYSAVYLDTFDTVISLIGFAADEASFQEQSALVHGTFQYLHKLFDCYNSYEDEGIVSVYTLNQRAMDAPVEVDPILFSLLKFAKTHAPMTGGQTNVALGSVLSIWHEYREAGIADPEAAALPDMAALTAAAAHTDLKNLILDEDASTVYYADPALRLDVGAVAKGYATEIVASMLLSGGMPSFIISAGGNVRVGNPPEDGRSNWGIGIQDPEGAAFGRSDIVDTLYLHGCSVVTSGDYQRFYVVDGKRYCHLIDPDTLMPGEYFRSVTIVTEDSGYADLLSTAAYLMPYEESRAFVESLEGVEGLWVFSDGTILMTDGLKPSAKSQGAVNPS